MNMNNIQIDIIIKVFPQYNWRNRKKRRWRNIIGGTGRSVDGADKVNLNRMDMGTCHAVLDLINYLSGT